MKSQEQKYILNKFKKCSKCKEEKSLDCFDLSKNGGYGVQSYCKDCMRIFKKKYYSKNKEKINKHSREYHLKNKEKINKYDREYYSKNKEKIAERQREYKLKNREKVRKKSREQRKQLADVYVANLITQRTDLTIADIPSDLIEAKRLEIKIKRIIKEE